MISVNCVLRDGSSGDIKGEFKNSTDALFAALKIANDLGLDPDGMKKADRVNVTEDDRVIFSVAVIRHGLDPTA